MAPFRRSDSFYVLLTPHLFNPNLGAFRCTRSPTLGVNERMGLKLFSREIVFQEFRHTWSRYLNVTEGQTDRQTDRQTDDMQSHNRAVKTLGNSFSYKNIQLKETGLNITMADKIPIQYLYTICLLIYVNFSGKQTLFCSLVFTRKFEIRECIGP